MNTANSSPQITLLVRTGCHLCQAARETLNEVTTRLGLVWSSVDIDDNPELLARHSEEVPVLLIDGKVRDFWVIDPARLESLLGG